MIRTSRALVGAAAVAVCLAWPAAAPGDGLPLPVEDTGPSGIADADGLYRYVSLPAGRDTLVARTVQNGGTVSASRIVRGRLTIPAVGLDGSAGGLSADGRTLILIRPRPAFPRRSTELVAVDPRGLAVRRRIALDGDFSFDAISPDGRTIYLIEYASPRDPTEYRVRAYDLRRKRLLAGAITDPAESEREMYGLALSRATTESGRWAFTLYWGSEHPFVHALDTVRGRARCIDLEQLAGVRDIGALDFAGPLAGSTLTVNRRGHAAALIDTETLEATAAPEPAAPAAAATPDRGPSAIVLIGGGGALAICAAAGLGALRRRSRLGGEG